MMPVNVPTMVSVLLPAERGVLTTIVALARDEFRDEPDTLRRLLSRIERLPAGTPMVDPMPVQLVGRLTTVDLRSR